MAKVTKAEQREATTQRLIEIARARFARDGYAHTATEELVEQAGVTRGALYHHFGSKEGLFIAVFNQIQAEIGARVEAAASQSDDSWDQLVLGCRAFLTASVDPQVQRIVLIDAPAVIGWQAWRKQDAENSMSLLRAALEELSKAGRIRSQPVEALTHLLSGAMNEAALWIAQSDQPEQALSEALTALDSLLNALRT
jgi:AcrR family transcriptional regulator